MSEINLDEVKKVAKLARIGLIEQECEDLSDELSNVLNWIDQLNQVETSHVTENWESIQLTPELMRTDTVTDGNQPAELLNNAPDRTGDYFRVPKVIE